MKQNITPRTSAECYKILQESTYNYNKFGNSYIDTIKNIFFHKPN
jgi:hypothetical protein